MIIDNGRICIYSQSRGLHPLKEFFNLKMGLLCTLVCYFDFPAFSKALFRLLKPLCGNIISLWLNSAKAAVSVDKSKSGVKDFRIFSCAEQTSKWKTNHERKRYQAGVTVDRKGGAWRNAGRIILYFFYFACKVEGYCRLFCCQITVSDSLAG